MSTNSNDPPMLAFRSRSTDETILVPTVLDTKSGQYAVLWSDIQDGFENAKSIRNGGALAPFLKDEGFIR